MMIKVVTIALPVLAQSRAVICSANSGGKFFLVKKPTIAKPRPTKAKMIVFDWKKPFVIRKLYLKCDENVMKLCRR